MRPSHFLGALGFLIVFWARWRPLFIGARRPLFTKLSHSFLLHYQYALVQVTCLDYGCLHPRVPTKPHQMWTLDLSGYSLLPQLTEGHIYKHVLFWLPDNQTKLIL